MRRIIREQEPDRPSTGVATLEKDELSTTAARRALEPPRLISSLRGDLDWIVMKCLEKDRTRRYETAGGLSIDIERHLKDEPVEARPPSTAYRLQKAWRRHKLAMSAGVAVCAAMTIGITVSTWQAKLAIRSKADAVQAQVHAVAESAAKEKALESARRNLYAADMVLAQLAHQAGNEGRTRELLMKHRGQQGDKDLRDWEWRYLWRQSRSDEQDLVGHHSQCVRGSLDSFVGFRVTK